MAYQTSGSQGNLVSWGSANLYSTMLSRITPASCTITVTNEDIDITGLNVEAAVMLPGLSSWTVDIKAFGFATPRLGNVGTCVFTGSNQGYQLHIQNYDVTAQTEQTHDITELATVPASGPTWKSFRPDSCKISGKYSALADSGTAASAPHPAGTTAYPTLTLLYGDSATDEAISGSAKVSQLSAAVARGSMNKLDYSFVGSGAWTPVGTASLFGAVALGTPIWSQGGSAAGAIVIASLTGSRTFTGADSFWTSLNLRVGVDRPVEFNARVQGTGALTFA